MLALGLTDWPTAIWPTRRAWDAQPIASRFLAYKLVQDLAYVPTTRNLLTAPDPLVKKVAATLRSSDWDMAKAVRTLLLADEFRYANPAQGRQRVRQPVELVVGACKALGITIHDHVVIGKERDASFKSLGLL